MTNCQKMPRHPYTHLLLQRVTFSFNQLSLLPNTLDLCALLGVTIVEMSF
ncbi:hypothetical protein [Shouchella lonarensis]|nr:hypothetical protein [Shouchella lonarensis]